MRQVLLKAASIVGWTRMRPGQRSLYEIPLPEKGRRAVQGCPGCGSLVKSRSRRRTLSERLIVLAGAKLRRCEGCKMRYARIGESAVYIDDLTRIVRVASAAAFGLGVLSATAVALLVP